MSKPVNFKYQPPFRPAQIREGKEVLVEFFCKNPFSGELDRYRIRLNYLRKKMPYSDLIRYAETVVIDINNKLVTGWSPELEDIDLHNRYKTIESAFTAFLRHKRKENAREDTIRTYKQLYGMLEAWLQDRYKQQLFIAQVTRKVAGEFSDYLIENRDVEARTYNNYINGLSTIF